MIRAGHTSLSYAGFALDRASSLRKKPAWIQQQFDNPESLIVPYWQGQIAVHCYSDPALDHKPIFVSVAEFESIPLEPEFSVFLGHDGESAIFAMDFSSIAEEDFPFVSEDIRLQDLRQAVHSMHPSHSAMLGFGKSVLHWHRNHLFCGTCGQKTESLSGGHMRLCTNAQCAKEHFPRIDPAVIMLVTNTDQETGESRCLLGRHGRFPERVFSTLAGFVDPGENLEEAVAREVFEEAGLEIHNIQYRGSQPWPFPSQLMLGFRAQADSEKITIDQDEIVEARWFTVEEIREGGDWGDDNFELWLPRRDSIARFLINEWLKEQ